jgi:N-acyl-D-aspartate/D-glutamate deacylase
MSYDLLIKNGTVVDRTGAPRRRADVAVKDGVIAEIGKINDGAPRPISVWPSSGQHVPGVGSNPMKDPEHTT